MDRILLATDKGALPLGGVGDAAKVTLAGTLAGEDLDKDWMKVADGADQYVIVAPAPTAAGVMPNSDKVLGTVGAAGDYLKALLLNVQSNTNASVYITDGTSAPLVNGVTGTAPAGTTTLTVTAGANFSATANQYAGNIVSVTYTPTGAAAPVTVKRRITAHAAVAAATGISLTLTHNIPAGATITAWSIEPLASSWEAVPFNQPVGIARLELGKRSVVGAWKISVDSGVQVDAVGKFS